MNDRPHIRPPLSQLDNRFELVAKILLLLLWCLSVYTFLKLPDRIPIHFDLSGQVDKYGNKLLELILPVIATGIYLLLSLLTRYPYIFNYPVRITEANAAKQYGMANSLLRFIKLSVLIVFFLVILITYLTALGIIKGLGMWFLPFIVILFATPVIIYISKAFKDK